MTEDEKAHRAASFIRSFDAANQSLIPPEYAIIAGTGLQAAAELDITEVELSNVPHLPQPTAATHSLKIRMGWIGNRDKKLVTFEGRVHQYEGYSARECARAVRIAHALGARTIITTCAAGNLDRNACAPFLSIPNNHISLQHDNPLAGEIGETPHEVAPMDQPYDRDLITRALNLAHFLHIPVGATGTLIGVTGPSLSTYAEYSFYRNAMRGEAITMSTIPEVIVARALGMRNLTICALTDDCFAEPAPLEKIIENAQKLAPQVRQLIRAILLNP